MKQRRVKIALAVLATTVTSGSATFANAQVAPVSCVDSMHYPKLTVPNLEYWASENIDNIGGTAETECRLTQQLTGLFEYVEKKLACMDPNHERLRGTHAKGKCVSGTLQTALQADLQLDPSLTDAQKAALKQAGIFQGSTPLKAQFRFANADSQINPDWKADVRALSIKVNLPGNKEQDFAFNNVPRFEINSLNNFVRTMQLQKGILLKQITQHVDPTSNELTPDIGSLGKFLVRTYNVLDGDAERYAAAVISIGSAASADKKWHSSYTNQVYWSTTTYAIGASNTIVKFGAMPCGRAGQTNTSELGRVELKSENEAQVMANEMEAAGVVTKAENFLGETLATQVNNKKSPLCYQLFVQFLDESTLPGFTASIGKSAMVEDPSQIWEGPVHAIAKLQMTDMVDQKVCDDPNNAVSVTSNESGITPLGQINRARDFVERASWIGRAKNAPSTLNCADL